MTKTFQRLTRWFAIPTALFYIVAATLPACLWADTPAPKPETKTSTTTSAKKKSPTNKTKPKPKKVEVKIEDSGYPSILIGPGDILFITVYGENGRAGIVSAIGVGDSQLNTDYQVDSEGAITYPFLGTVHLGGLTPVQASEKIAKLLHKPRKVTVLIKESNTYWVSIMGNVLKPGKYQIHGKPTLLSALAEAGGALPDSDLGGTILIHKGNKLRVDLGDFLHGQGKMKPEPYLYPGDVLSVSKSSWPSLGEFAIIGSILASAAVITVELTKK